MTVNDAPKELQSGLDTHQPISGEQAVPDTPKTASLRIRGLDAARGLALIGMIIVHTMPRTDPASGDLSLLHELFAGHSAALFGLLAGVSLALITGAADPHTGRRLRRDRVSIAIRAVLLLVLGMVLNLLPLNVFSILPFYAVYFLLGILFTGVGVRALFAWAGVFALGGPVVVYAVNLGDAFESTASPDLMQLFTQPVMVVLSLTVTGYYPAITWMVYLVLGIALGRLDLRELSIQIKMCVWGAFAAGSAAIGSQLMVFHFGVYERILVASPLAEGEIAELLEFGGAVPAHSWWWLAADGPHSNTPFSVVGSAGLAVFILGAFLLAARVAETQLSPVGAAGSMTFTFYSAHLLLLTFVDVWEFPVPWTLGQILFAIVFGWVWRGTFGQGPMEYLVSKTSKWVGRTVVPEKSGMDVEQQPPASSFNGDADVRKFSERSENPGVS